MTTKDFLNIFADAIQQHEGWENGKPSVMNNNPGNVKYMSQPNTRPGAGNFCVTPNFLGGRRLLTHDIELKMAKYFNIRAILSVYAPPSDNNDTESYIRSVVAYFHKRNIPVTDTMPISDILALPIEMVLIVINNLSTPADWHSVQDSIDFCAKQMPEFGFSTRYVSQLITPDNFYANPSPIGSLYALDVQTTREILGSLNEGQKLNALYYMVIKAGEAGGVQYGGEAVSYEAPATAFCSVLYEGAPFSEGTGRSLFHELTHCLFTLVGVRDYLHDYLVSHGGYAQNNLLDIQAVYADIVKQYKLGTRIVEVAKTVVAIAQNNPDQPYIIQLLIGLGNLLGRWLQR